MFCNSLDMWWTSVGLSNIFHANDVIKPLVFQLAKSNSAPIESVLSEQTATVHTENHQCLFSILKHLQNVFLAMKHPHWMKFRRITEVEKLAKLVLVNIPSSCESERSFSGLRRLKSWLRSTMTAERLNSCAVMHIHFFNLGFTPKHSGKRQTKARGYSGRKEFKFMPIDLSVSRISNWFKNVFVKNDFRKINLTSQ